MAKKAAELWSSMNLVPSYRKRSVITECKQLALCTVLKAFLFQPVAASEARTTQTQNAGSSTSQSAGVLHLGQASHRHKSRLRADWVESSAEKRLGGAGC